jgi:hypothetical protein
VAVLGGAPGLAQTLRGRAPGGAGRAVESEARRANPRAGGRHGRCILVAIGDRYPPPKREDVMTTTETSMDKNLSRLEAQLEVWSGKLHELLSRATAAGQQARVDSKKQFDELKGRLEVARTKLDEARAAGSEKWEVFKDGVERAWDELEATFKKMME